MAHVLYISDDIVGAESLWQFLKKHHHDLMRLGFSEAAVATYVKHNEEDLLCIFIDATGAVSKISDIVSVIREENKQIPVIVLEPKKSSPYETHAGITKKVLKTMTVSRDIFLDMITQYENIDN